MALNSKSTDVLSDPRPKLPQAVDTGAIQETIASTGVPQQCQSAIKVEHGNTVRIRAVTANVANVIQVGSYKEMVRADGLGYPLYGGQEIILYVDSTTRIWYRGQAGDSVAISVGQPN